MNRNYWAQVRYRLLRKILRAPEDFPMYLGTVIQPGSMFVPVHFMALWNSESRLRKLYSLLTLQWQPSEEALQRESRERLLHEVFGQEEDLGTPLFNVMHWHYSIKRDLAFLTEADTEKAQALEAFSVLTRIRLGEFRSDPPLNLALAARAPHLAMLAVAMVIKIPVRAFQFFLDVDIAFAFNSIRKAQHPCTNELIAYLYEVLFLQQKTAIALHEYVRLSAFSHEQKGEAVFINAEVDAIMYADLVFSYLKASLEKTIAIVGFTYNLRGLDNKKTHKTKLATLRQHLPADIEERPYGDFLLECLKPENLAQLNNYRSGLLHKMGIADLQPHNYRSVRTAESPVRKMFEVLHQQHAINTALLLSALALLTDELVVHEPPDLDEDRFNQLTQIGVKAAQVMEPYLKAWLDRDADLAS